MTALNLHVGRDSVTLLTDCGIYNFADGTIAHIGPKAWVSDSLKLAMGITGLSSVWERLLPIAEAATSQSDILAALPEVLRWLDSDERFSESNRNTRIGVAFWAEGVGPKACYAVGARGKKLSEAPYRLLDVKGFAQPFVDGAYEPGVALTKESARRLIQAQRWVKEDGNYCVGGGAELITIDAAGIRDEIIAEWPQDRVGRKIDPRPWWRRLRG